MCNESSTCGVDLLSDRLRTEHAKRVGKYVAEESTHGSSVVVAARRKCADAACCCVLIDHTEAI